MLDFQRFSERELAKVEEIMLQEIVDYTENAALAESMTYSVEAGGKRIRPLLLLTTMVAFGQPLTTGAYQSAAALEMVHTYSLIHDDLPAMDNDDYRRGKLTNHKVYGEALAILAGDGLLTLAFQVMAQAEVTGEQKIQLLQLLSQAAGTQGMVAGQVADIQGENQTLQLADLWAIHDKKTGALIRFAFLAGGILSNQPEAILVELTELARHLGLAFQIRDDILDVTSTKELLGKEVGRDQVLQKSTYPALLGLKGAKEALETEINLAKQTIIRMAEIDSNFNQALFIEIVKKFE